MIPKEILDTPNDLYEGLVNADFITKIGPLLNNGGFMLDLYTSKIVPAMPKQEHTSPWLYVKRAKNRQCALWWRAFSGCGILHPFCAERCWKVVVRPRTVKELFILLAIEKDLSATLGLPCKCGIEQRKYTAALYGGYFYADSKAEGKEVYQEVRNRVSAEIGSYAAVILKQGCTEIEMRRGGRFQCTDEDRKWAALMDTHCDLPVVDSQQPGIVQIKVLRGWLEFAWEHGDMTAKEFNGGEPYTIPPVTYHEEETE